MSKGLPHSCRGTPWEGAKRSPVRIFGRKGFDFLFVFWLFKVFIYLVLVLFACLGCLGIVLVLVWFCLLLFPLKGLSKMDRKQNDLFLFIPGQI